MKNSNNTIVRDTKMVSLTYWKLTKMIRLLQKMRLQSRMQILRKLSIIVMYIIVDRLFTKEDNKMKKMRVMVVKYGYIDIEAEIEEEALELAYSKPDHAFDWSEFDDAQVIDDNVDQK